MTNHEQIDDVLGPRPYGAARFDAGPAMTLMEVHVCCAVCRRRLRGTAPTPGGQPQSCHRRACVVELALRRRTAAKQTDRTEE